MQSSHPTFTLLKKQSLLVDRFFIDYFLYRNIDSTNLCVERLLKLRDRAMPFVVESIHQEDGIGRRGARWLDLGVSTLLSIYVPYELDKLIGSSTAPLRELANQLKLFFESELTTIKIRLSSTNDLFSENGGKFSGAMIKELASGYVVGIGTNWYMSKLESLALSESLGREATALNLLVKRDEVELLSRLKVYYLDAIIKNLISPLSRSSPRP